MIEPMIRYNGVKVNAVMLRERLEQWRAFNDWERRHGDVRAASLPLTRELAGGILSSQTALLSERK
jgi:hypothetical protein